MASRDHERAYSAGMRRCDIDLEINCTPARFWSLYFDADFTERIFREGLGWDAPTVLDYRESEAEIVRRLSARPKLDLPGKVAKLLGDQFGYEEEGRFDRAKQVFEFRHRTKIFGDKLDLGGRSWAEPVGEDRMRWRTEMKVSCSVFGVGGLLERSAEQNIHQSYPTTVAFWNRWLAQNPAS